MANMNKSRRRSFVDMKRKSMVFDEIFNNPELSTERVAMEEYKTNLKREKQQWNDVLLTRKRQCVKSKERQQYCPLAITQSEVYYNISDDNRKFLEDKPNYIGMLETIEKHVKASKSWGSFKAEVIASYDEIQEVIQDKQKLLIDKLCSDKSCELCHIYDCQNQDHKFPLF